MESPNRRVDSTFNSEESSLAPHFVTVSFSPSCHISLKPCHIAYHCLWTCACIAKSGVEVMLGWSLTFLLVAVVAAVLGFSSIAVAFAGIAKFIFALFLVLFLVSLLTRALRSAS